MAVEPEMEPRAHPRYRELLMPTVVEPEMEPPTRYVKAEASQSYRYVLRASQWGMEMNPKQPCWEPVPEHPNRYSWEQVEQC